MAGVATRYPYQQPNIPLGYRNQLNLPEVSVGNITPGNFGQAAGIVDIGNAYKSLSEKHDYDGMIANQFVNDANEYTKKMEVEGALLGQYALSNAQIEAAKYNFDQGMASIDNAKSAQRSAGIMGTIGTVAKFALPLAMGLSDENYKNTIEKLENATAKLRELEPVTFKYNKETGYDPERKHHGFIAQKYREVLPDATYDLDGTLAIDLMDVIGILVKGFQEMDTRIARLEAARSLAGVK